MVFVRRMQILEWKVQVVLVRRVQIAQCKVQVVLVRRVQGSNSVRREQRAESILQSALCTLLGSECKVLLVQGAN